MSVWSYGRRVESGWRVAKRLVSSQAFIFFSGADRVKLYVLLEWEDEGIKEHASELLAKINAVLPKQDDQDEDDEDESEAEWEDDEDDEMAE